MKLEQRLYLSSNALNLEMKEKTFMGKIRNALNAPVSLVRRFISK